MRKFGEFVHSLSGRYAAEDVGMETADMDIVRDVTPMLLEFQRKEVELETHHLYSLWCVCRYESCCKTTIWFRCFKWKKVLVQGIGHVGETLVDYLTKEVR
jgi:leucine dehydrogenase